MTRAELRVLASGWLDDPNNGYFTVAQVDVWLNNAQREVQKLLLNAAQDYYTICVKTTTVVNQADYLLPTDFLKVLRFAYVTDGTGDLATYQKISKITRNERDLVGYGPSGDPICYYLNKNTLTMVPTPNRGVEIHLDYAYRVADMDSDSDEPDVPDDYQEYIAVMAARDGFLKDGRDMSPINQKLAYFEKLLKENSQQRTQDSPRYVVSTGSGYGYY